jgi:hypothetical protein
LTWKNERTFFNSGKYHGTLGKFQYLADLASHKVETSRRPYQTVSPDYS